jgi:hypothetical protein
MSEGNEAVPKRQSGLPHVPLRPDREEIFAKAVCLTGVFIIWGILALIILGFLLGYGSAD